MLLESEPQHSALYQNINNAGNVNGYFFNYHHEFFFCIKVIFHSQQTNHVKEKENLSCLLEKGRMREFGPFDSFENFSGNHGQTMLPFSHRFGNEGIRSEAISMRKNKGVAALSMDSGINTAVLETSSNFSEHSIFVFYWKFAAKNMKINGKVEQKSLRLPITMGAFFALISAFAWPAFSLLYGQMFTTLAQLNASNSSPSITIGI